MQTKAEWKVRSSCVFTGEARKGGITLVPAVRGQESTKRQLMSVKEKEGPLLSTGGIHTVG